MTDSLARDEALAYADRAERAVEYLDQVHRDKPYPGQRAEISRTHQDIGLCLKLAEVHAVLAIADELRALRLQSPAGGGVPTAPPPPVGQHDVELVEPTC